MSVKKILSIIMALAIVLTMASFPAFAADAVRLTYDEYSSSVSTVSWGKPLSNLFVRDDGICEFAETMYTKPLGEGTFNLYLDPTGDVAYSVSKIELKAAYSTHFTSFAIYGSNEAATAEAEWTLLADYTTTEGASNAIVTREFEHEGGYKYFRFEGYGIGKKGEVVESGKPQYKYILLYGAEYVETPTPEIKEDTVESLGANIRLASDTVSAGLRFGATVNKADLLIEGDYVYDAESDVKIGMYLLPAEKLEEGETLEAYITAGKTEALDVPAKKVYAQDDETITFTAVLVGIPEEAYDKEIVAVPYVKVGEETTYFEQKTQSYKGVAQAAYDAHEAGTAVYTDEQVKALKVILGLPIETTYTVNYVDAEGNPVADVKNGAGNVGDEVTENAVEVEGYTADNASATITLIDGVNTITFTYTKNEEPAPEPVRLAYDAYTSSVSTVSWGKPLSNLFVRDDGICEFAETMYTKPLGEGTFNLYLDPTGDVAYNISKIEMKSAYSNHFSAVAVYGSNDAATPEAEWTLLANFTGLEGGKDIVVTREFEHEGGYKYFRFEGYGIAKNGAEVESGKPQYKFILLYGIECAE